jgi:hypothetical protein
VVNTIQTKAVKAVHNDNDDKDETDTLVETTMNDHRRLMRIFNKKKLQNRINVMRQQHGYDEDVIFTFTFIFIWLV